MHPFQGAGRFPARFRHETDLFVNRITNLPSHQEFAVLSIDRVL